MFKNKLTLILVLFVFNSCADYRFQRQDNPFAQYGVKSLSIPMFYNDTNFANISSDFTAEVYRMLSGFKGLEIKNGLKEADAILIGIIKSRKGLRQSRSGGDLRAVKSILGENYPEDRNDFYVPSTNTLGMTLQVIVMKQPTQEEIDFLKSSIGGQQIISSKILFRESIPISGRFSREIYASEGMDVIGTQNRGAQKQTINNMAQNAAVSFRDMILYAF